jgi:beta-glucosidase
LRYYDTIIIYIYPLNERFMKRLCTLFMIIPFVLNAQQKWEEVNLTNGIKKIKVNEQITLGYSETSGVKILVKDGLPFKDLNKNGVVDIYEDWRLNVNERAEDLASRMSVEQIAGLMLYSGHQTVPMSAMGRFKATYNGKAFPESGAMPSDLTDQQIQFLKNDNLRHVLLTSVQNPTVAATWNNNIQKFVESIGLGIPANNSSDPRNGANKESEYNAGSGGTISQWPEELGLAATFDPSITLKFGSIASKEYRALGITTALSPQIDLATEPRWNRFIGTFGEDPKLATDMSRAYVDGFQTSPKAIDNYNGWGNYSVNAMVKHWPGGGPEEAGRDGHFAYGKFAVYPGNNFQMHLRTFTEGAFKLKGSTKKAAAVMPYYTISFNQDKKNGENVGNAYSKYLITDLLRNKYDYNGVVCTDWLVTANEGEKPNVFWGKSWGVEKLSVAERHYKVLMAGADQFGGNNDAKPVLEAYQMGVKEHGEAFMRVRFEQSAIRLLLNIFRVGLFENAYLDPIESNLIVGKSEFMKAGYDAQLKSIVLIKNKNKSVPIVKGKTVYIPKRITPAGLDFFGQPSPEKSDYPVNLEIVKRYYNVTDDPTKADFAIVFIKSPISGGYSSADRAAGGNGYVPISLQLKDYTATDAREHSMAAGDPVIDPTITDRTYKGKTSKSNTYPDLQTIFETKQAMNGKPVLVSISISNPMVFGEFEKEVDAIIGEFGVQVDAQLDIISGKVEPSGLLPMQMPLNMSVVEKQYEDKPHDMKPYKDAQGHVYDFGYGLNWKGVIRDARTIKYAVKK